MIERLPLPVQRLLVGWPRAPLFCLLGLGAILLVGVVGEYTIDFARPRHWGESIADRLERECKEIVAKVAPTYHPEGAYVQNLVQECIRRRAGF